MFTSSAVKWRGPPRTTTSTPVTSPSASSGTPISESMSSSARPEYGSSAGAGSWTSTGSRPAATRPAKPSPNGNGSDAAVERPAARRGQGQLALGRQEDRRGVRVQHAAHVRHEVGQDVVERAVGERRVHEQLHAADQLGHPLGLGARGLLAHERLALLLLAPPVRDVPDEAGDERLPSHVDLRHRGLGGEARAVTAHELDLEALGRRLVRVDQRASPLVVAIAELGRDHQLPHRLPDRLRRGPAEHPLRGDVPPSDDAVGSSVMKASGALSSTIRVRSSLSLSPRARSSASARRRAAGRASARSAARRSTACPPPAASGPPGCPGPGSRARPRRRRRCSRCGRARAGRKK